MEIEGTKIADLLIIKPQVHEDERGYFFESYNYSKFSKLEAEFNFIQDNEVKSNFGVLRGLHFQNPPYSQTKLIRVIQGEILDVVIDLRKKSETYGSIFSIKLSEVNKYQLLVPRGFAHGYAVLSEVAVVAYKVDNEYMPSQEDGILWNDETLAIDWRLDKENVIVSEKDKILQNFKDFNSPF